MMETFIVYDMHEDGKHRGGKRIVGTVENLASYICRIEDTHRCIVSFFILNGTISFELFGKINGYT